MYVIAAALLMDTKFGCMNCTIFDFNFFEIIFTFVAAVNQRGSCFEKEIICMNQSKY